MSTPVTPSVSVVITAYDAAATIGDAVRSALAEPETAEVIVVDDASRDATAAAAEAAGRGDARLKVIRCAVNGGPAAARNRALEVAVGTFVAVLDADDFLLPDRFARLLAVPDWDMVADNILFVAEAASPAALPPLPPVTPALVDIDLAGFVRANHSARGTNRQEWGFLKPVMRRDFLDAQGLRYDEALRLGEDYDLYVRMLQKGARFRVSAQVGYAARWRADSLSSRHRTADLKALHAAARAHLALPGLSGEARRVLDAHAAELRQRFLLRDFLDRRARVGRAGAVLSALARPETLVPVTRGILSDKLAARRPSPPSRIGRLLIEGDNTDNPQAITHP
ncbi:glycosyltransferase family 2 protein [Paracoccus chinensis]|uniref:Succinoglycan biosynthesis protein ExoU n=1 Tax=Paracoccus chinensis TaxID=525640 RepID=A0A1G9P8G9_9RHOB|nr:glycosyltransferase family 2 protein [Paracoccus chinensis]SDL95050.1 succinoglycan biosynthesis protein ExoU [Paracoccus chinensis]